MGEDNRTQLGNLVGWLECGGVRHPISLGEARNIGRNPKAAILLEDDTVSWDHAAIGSERGGVPMVWDKESHNGTFVDGKRAGSRGIRLRHGAIVHFGDLEARVFLVKADENTGRLPHVRRFLLDGVLTIGRADDNDVILQEASVSRHHAVLRSGTPPTIEDLHSRNSVRLGASAVTVSSVAPGDEITIGTFRLSFDGSGLVVSDRREGPGLQAVNVTARAGGRQILQPTTVTVGRGELVALIGPSGSGKSTLLRILAGVSSPATGEVMVDDQPIFARLPDIGYVPQQDTIHRRLTVREALRNAALLRLPADTDDAELSRGVDAVMAELALSERAETRIGDLSGGQMKRVACGVELVGEPTILLLDEPTSGLDPPLERQLMNAIREMADRDRGIVVTTHATSSLFLCDTLVVMGAGGRLAFVGPPHDAIEHFGVADFDELYARVERQTEADRGEEQVAPRRATERPPAAPALGDRSFWRQFRVLVRRYRQTLTRDRRTMAVLLGQTPVMAVLIALLFGGDFLAFPDRDPGKSAQFAFLLITAALWLGLISSCREIVNERAIVLREISIGARVEAYVLSKTLVLFALTAIQAAILLGVATTIKPLHQEPQAYMELYAVLVGAAWAAVGMGLTISTLARSVDQATSFVPLLLIPQLLFAGALVTVEAMGQAVQIVSDLVVARWAYAGAGSAIELNRRFAADPSQAKLYGDSFFSIPATAAFGIELLFAAAGLFAVCVMLRRRRYRPMT